MSDLKTFIDEFARVADLAATVLPAAGIAAGTARIGSKLVEIIDDLKPHATGESATALQAAHDAIVAAVVSKAEDTSARLRNEGDA